MKNEEFECFNCDETFEDLKEKKNHRKEEHPEYDEAMNSIGSSLAEETM